MVPGRHVPPDMLSFPGHPGPPQQYHGERGLCFSLWVAHSKMNSQTWGKPILLNWGETHSLQNPPTPYECAVPVRKLFGDI